MLRNYLQNKQKMLLEQQTDFYTSTGLHVFFKDPVENVDVEKVIAKVESTIPESFIIRSRNDYYWMV